jgi:AcrR family transcriptional regulator
MAVTKRAVKRKPTLRDAQKAHTRQCILDAARTVFFREGYYGSTVDQIVTEAGASRPTFYLHFRDKEQILGELMAAYAARAVPLMERLPGPRPTIDEVKAWLLEVGAFLEQEQALASVITEVSTHRQANRPRYGLALIDAWIQALGSRAPAFAAAVKETPPDVNARARAQLLIIEVAWAGEHISMNKEAAFTEQAVSLVATALHDFLNDKRFHAASSQRQPVGAARARASQERHKGRQKARVAARST